MQYLKPTLNNKLFYLTKIFKHIIFVIIFFSEPPKPAKDISSNNVIDTKPNAPKKEAEIKPTKTQVPSDNKPPATSKKVSSVVQVQSNPSPSIATKVEVKSSPSVKVNVIEGKPSAVVPKSPVIVSKVQVSVALWRYAGMHYY